MASLLARRAVPAAFASVAVRPAGAVTVAAIAFTPHYRRLGTSAAATKSKNLIIFGAPGSGKGTVSKRIVRDFGVQHISTGDLLRLHIYHGTELGSQASNYMRTGALVPDKVVIDMLLGELDKVGAQSWLLDGFPRTIEQAQALESANIEVAAVLSLDVPDNEIIRRVGGRYVHVASGRVYNLEYNPPKKAGFDDLTGEPLVKREDDDEKNIRKRLDAFHATAAPLLKYYEKKGLLKRFGGKTSDEIYAKVQPELTSLLGGK